VSEDHRIGEAAQMLGVRVETLRRWEREGKLRTSRTSGGQRRIPDSEIARLLIERRERPKVTAGSVRNRFPGVVTEVKRDKLAATVEILTPDFLDVEEQALATVLEARPDVFGHNIETVRRLHARMRGAKASYDKALWLLRRVKELADYRVLTKSGIIVGLGETNDEVVETMRDLRAHGVDVVTIGQYLQPSPKHAVIDRWVHPDEFRWFREQGEALGFGSVFSGPLVRSSYRADEQRHAAETGRGAVTY
jgi:lipoic acid synthetase